MNWVKHPISPFLPVLVIAAVVAGVTPVMKAQAVVNVSGASSQFESWKLASGSTLLDVQADQQTGLTQGDVMGLAAGATGYSTTPTADVPSTMVTAGTIGGADSIAFRFRMTDKNGNKTYVGSTISVGIGFAELSASGAVTIYATVESSNSGNKFFFQSGGAGLNDGPSTTTLDSGAFVGNPYSKAAPLALTTGTNWSYITDVTTLGEINYDRTGVNGTDVNSYITFATTFADLQTATRALTGNATFTMNYTTEMAFVAWTSTQTNAINQDINGVSGIPTTTWSAMGAFTDYVTADGKKKPIPETSTVVQVGALLAIGLAGLYRRRRSASAAGKPAAVVVA